MKIKSQNRVKKILMESHEDIYGYLPSDKQTNHRFFNQYTKALILEGLVFKDEIINELKKEEGACMGSEYIQAVSACIKRVEKIK